MIAPHQVVIDQLVQRPLLHYFCDHVNFRFYVSYLATFQIIGGYHEKTFQLVIRGTLPGSIFVFNFDQGSTSQPIRKIGHEPALIYHANWQWVGNFICEYLSDALGLIIVE